MSKLLNEKRSFLYDVFFNNGLAAGTNTSAVLHTENDSYFALNKVLFSGVDQTDVGATPNSPSNVPFGITIQLTDMQTGKTFFDNPIEASSIFGGISEATQLNTPAVFSSSLVFSPNAAIEVELNNYSARNYVAFYFSFIGIKQYIQRYGT